jgi:transposase
MRFIGLDVHRDFCEVAIAEGGRVRRAGRVETTPTALELFGQSLAADDQVALEATGNALAIVRIIESHVGRVVLANPKAVKNATRSAKTDKLDARTLAKLLAAGFLPEVWSADEQTRVLRRRISRRAQLVRQRTREKNQVHAILIRNLKGRAPATDLFGSAGRRWLASQQLPVDEREMLEACLRGIDFLDREVAAIARALAELVLASAELRRLLTLPGVNIVAACALLAAIGDIRRFPTARQLVGYLGLDPKVRQSGSEPAPARPHLQAGPRRDAARARRSGLARGARQRTAARLPPADRCPPRQQHRHRRRRPQARRDRLAHAQTRRGLRLRPPLTHPREDPQARARDRRPTPEGKADRRLGYEGAAPTRQAARRTGRARLPPPRPRLAAHHHGHGCRTGARILSAVKRPSSAAGESPTSCALARGHPRPRATLAKEPPLVWGAKTRVRCVRRRELQVKTRKRTPLGCPGAVGTGSWSPGSASPGFWTGSRSPSSARSRAHRPRRARRS